MKTKFHLPLLLFFVFLLLVTVGLSNNNEKIIPNSDSIHIAEYTDFPTFIQFNSNSQLTISQLEDWIKTVSKNDKIGISLLNKTKDELGFEHYRYKQTISDIPVELSMIIVHVKEGKIYSINGDLFTKKIPTYTNTSISFSSSIEQAKSHIRAVNYKWELPSEETFIKREQENDSATFFPKKKFVFIPKDGKRESELVKAYELDIYAHEPLSRSLVYVDVNDGRIIYTRELIHEGDVVGSATTVYSGVQSFTTDSYSGSFRLREAGRGNGIETYNMQGGNTYGLAIDFIDTDNSWNNVNSSLDQYATDAHWGTEKVYDYFLNSHSRNSIDGMGYKLRNYVHHSVGRNAFWDGSRMTYGDGDPTKPTLSLPLTTLDIIGHEITHGLINNTANLVYFFESGALNESFADIFGATIDFRARPSKANWTMGEECSNSGVDYIRSLSNPNDKNHPDTYYGQHWYFGLGDNGGVHINSGVQNFWYYLLTNGGADTNDIGNAYAVPGITLDKAEKIAFRNLTVYLSVNSQYIDARNFAIQSAIDLYGDCSIEVYATTEAWFAVGVGDRYVNEFQLSKTGGWCSNDIVLSDTAHTIGSRQWYRDGVLLPGDTSATLNISSGGYGAGYYTLHFNDGIVCGFSSYAVSVPVDLVPDFNFNNSCAEHIIAFTDLSIGANIVKREWNFGNGTTSLENSPTIKFNSSGSYTVSLIVTDIENCVFSISKTVVVNYANPMVLNGCVCSPSSFIPNHSFEDKNCCPINLQTFSLPCAKDWIQASGGTSDYFNTCGNFTARSGANPPPTPLPNGAGYVGFWDSYRNSVKYKEYVGACLNNSLIAGKEYILQFYISHGFGTVNEPLAIFGSSNCSDIPFAGNSVYECPTLANPNFIELHSQTVTILPGSWHLVTFVFTPSQDINSVVLGPACATNTGSNYYYMDDLSLSTKTRVDLISQGHICKDNLTLLAVPLTPGGFYLWFKDGVEILGETDSILNVSLNNYGPGKYTVMYVIRDECGMDDQEHFKNGLEANFGFNEICQGETTNFIDSSTIFNDSIIKWKWESGSVFSTSQNPNYIFNSSGVFPVTLTVTSDTGCTEQITKMVNVFSLPKIQFDYVQNDGTIFDTKVCFENNSSNAVTYFWDFDDGTTSVHKQPGCIEFPTDKGGTYNVCLEAISDKGCESEECIEIKIKGDNSVYFPNTFTPNGDGLNDVFGPVFSSENFIVSYNFNIFNKWGEIIFSSSDLSRHWDGSHNGVKVKSGTYVWNLRFKDEDGVVKQLMGHILVLK